MPDRFQGIRLRLFALRFTGLLGLFMSCFAIPVAAQAQTAGQVFERGLDAYDRGDFRNAAVLFEQACNGGIPSSCSNLAVLFMTGEGVPADRSRGIAMFDAACRLGSEEACDNAATARRADAARSARAAPAQGPVVASSIPASIQACNNGSQSDCVRAGRALTLGEGVRADLAAARPILIQACEGGDAQSCSWAGIALERGEGGPVDLVRAGTFYLRACEANLRRTGCAYLGRFYDLAGEIALSEAAYARACDSANLESCQQQAQMLIRMGRELQSLPILDQACAADYPSACALLGWVEYGRENFEAANLAYAKACRLGVECAFASELATALERRQQWFAERANERAEMVGLLQAGDISGAIDFAVYDLRSGPLASEVIQLAINNNRIGSINTQTLYVLANWFRDSPIRASVDRELRARGTGLEGTFGTGTNQPGMAEARWRTANGGGNDAYSSYQPSASSAPARPPVLSTADAAAQTRDSYRSAHCQMPGSNSSAAVCN